ncbi:SDR family NAD(P)-dependent oxidoreductase [Burkholderia sp. L27(2015)]|uniref:SDR family NAD(P)-dependent oxidoreductase n=1 Tax=Burkholderia sp. L27(2015) TaxID=1641858 RepID=UPI00131D33B7|nr:SDR family NAD(P)-dependent oxidoreductase [Burkholderia sp. L27(2015)]
MKALQKFGNLGRPRVLIVGCGDVGTRCIDALGKRFRIFAVTRDLQNAAALRMHGATPVYADLDRPGSLHRIAALAPWILHLAPPPTTGATDTRTRSLLAALGRAQARGRAPLRRSSGNTPSNMPRIRPRNTHAACVPRMAVGRLRRRMASLCIVPEPGLAPARILSYASTSGVYGDCAGALIDETRPTRPANPRAIRRVDAETALRDAGVRGLISLRVMRIPGIYAADRLPLARLNKGTPALCPADDVYTSHIHADDLASILCRALWRGMPQRVVHASDDSRLKMGDYFDLVARTHGLPLPRRIAREQAGRELEPMLLSFMRESRRLDNTRLKRELGVRLRYPSVTEFLQEYALQRTSLT